MVCGLFSVFWLSFGMLQLPTLGLAQPYATEGGAASKEFNAVVALYLIVWGFALFTFFIFTLKTNAVFAGIFLFVTLAAWVSPACLPSLERILSPWTGKGSRGSKHG
jgi:uncharacterized protein